VIRDDAVRLGNGDFSIRPAPSGVAELDETAEALADTARRLDHSLTREREFSANASHQLRTPITAMRLAVETENITPRRDRTEILNESLQELDRVESTIETLLAVARDRPLRREPIDVASIVVSVRLRWERPLAKHGRLLRVVTSEQPSAHVSADVLGQILDVLMGNAVTHGTGEVVLTIEDDGSSLAVTISDQGSIGADRDHLFVRRDPGAGGYGVGLALARTVAEAEGGRLNLARSSPTTFRVVLPDLAMRPSSVPE
jgi:signal transduction histidine kinase